MYKHALLFTILIHKVVLILPLKWLPPTGSLISSFATLEGYVTAGRHLIQQDLI